MIFLNRIFRCAHATGKNILLLVVCSIAATSFAQHKKAYALFTASGEETDYGKMISTLDEADVILFGEQHNSAIAHWLQLEVASSLFEKDSLVLGAEMFERNDEKALQGYIKDSLDEKTLDSLAGLWPNYKTDYAPLLRFAKEKNIPFVGTNIPRKYANLVYKKGFRALDSLSDTEKKWIAPLPIAFDPDLPTYKSILKMAGGHGSPNLVKAQAIKDATMAYFIEKNRKENHIFLHLNGAFHSDYFEGILWYLKKLQPDANYTTISTVLQEDLSKLDKEHREKADFILVVDKNVTKTH